MAVTPELTLEQFLRVEDTKPASEYACGEAFEKPMPSWDHSAIAQLGGNYARSSIWHGGARGWCPPGAL